MPCHTHLTSVHWCQNEFFDVQDTHSDGNLAEQRMIGVHRKYLDCKRHMIGCDVSPDIPHLSSIIFCQMTAQRHLCNSASSSKWASFIRSNILRRERRKFCVVPSADEAYHSDRTHGDLKLHWWNRMVQTFIICLQIWALADLNLEIVSCFTEHSFSFASHRTWSTSLA